MIFEVPANRDFETYFKDCIQTLQSKLESTMPAAMDAQGGAFMDALQQLQDAYAARDEAGRAGSGCDEAERVVQERFATCQSVAYEQILTHNGGVVHSMMSESFDDADLVTYVVLKQTTAIGMRLWCSTSDERAEQVVSQLLNNVPRMRQFLAAGGARNGVYGPAIEIYGHILHHQAATTHGNDSSLSTTTRAVLDRLAVAVALELAEGVPLFKETGETINAVNRYKHYEQAYLNGELDPVFGRFSTWELRQVVNGDASDEELSWGRASLRAYRPDLVLSDDPMWRYGFIVKSDMAYANPDWYKSPRSYDQLLSGGGKCGPRAWYGRFINKAFGIPTWGVRQTGHAAVLRWTHNVHWDICLGANVEKSYWDGDRCGWDFQLETQARNYCTSEMEHMYQVQRLEWMALLYNEKGDSVRQRSVPDVKSPWHALAFLQRYRLSRLHGLTNYVFRFEPSEPDTVPHNQTLTLHQKQQQNAIASEAVTYDGVTDSLIIPASVLSGGTTSNKVTVMPSFLGGQQVFVKEDATIEYTVDIPMEWKATTSHGRQYSLTCRVATAHRSEQPIAVTVVSEGGSDKSNSSSSIVLPYTTGVWAETDPVAVTIESATSITIRLSRPNQPFGFSIKDLRLTPVRP